MVRSIRCENAPILERASFARWGALRQVVPVTLVGFSRKSRQDAAPTGAVWPGLLDVFQDAVELVEVVVADNQLS
jgi:hypothetical protein